MDQYLKSIRTELESDKNWKEIAPSYIIENQEETVIQI